VGVDAENARADQSRLDEDAAGPTHRVQDRRARTRAGGVGQRSREQGVHAPGLEERAVRGFARAVVPVALGDQPPERTRTLGEQRPEFLVRVLKVDREPAVDEDRPEFAFRPLCLDTGPSPDVDGAYRDRPRPVEGGVRERRPGAVDVRVGPGEEFAGPAGVREVADAVGDRPRSRKTGRQECDVRGGTSGLEDRKVIVLPAQFEDVHGRTRGRTTHQGVGRRPPTIAAAPSSHVPPPRNTPRAGGPRASRREVADPS